MAWTIEYNDELEMVILIYTGKVSGRDIREAAAARIDLGKRRGVTEFLIDTKHVKADGSATFDIYDIPDKLYDEKHVLYENNLAIIGPDSEESMEMVRFFETACLNRGWTARIFKDRESAVTWLEEIRRKRSPERDQRS